jgi:hypothetical protein
VSQLQAIGLLLCGFAITLSMARSMRAGRFGPIERDADPAAFWGMMAFFAVIVTVGAGVATLELAA